MNAVNEKIDTAEKPPASKLDSNYTKNASIEQAAPKFNASNK